jgi:hypothetical protein
VRGIQGVDSAGLKRVPRESCIEIGDASVFEEGRA